MRYFKVDVIRDGDRWSAPPEMLRPAFAGSMKASPAPRDFTRLRSVSVDLTPLRRNVTRF